MNTFDRQVCEVVAHIPEGRVTTYGAIAKALGKDRSSRMVGWILNRQLAAGLPAHRVVNRNGLLTGRIHFDPPSAMEDRLKAEGVQVQQNKVVRFQELFWDPAVELLKEWK